MKRVARRTWVRSAGGTAALALALSGVAGCSASATTAGTSAGSSASAGVGTVSGAPATPTDTSTDATDRPSPSASLAVPDGRSAAYLTGVDGSAKTLTFDPIDFLTGDAAKTEWKKEHPENPDGPDNDYLIVNDDKTLRTLPVAPDAQCVVLSTLGGTDTKTISFAAFPAFLKQQSDGMTLPPPDISPLPFWLTVQHGTIVKIEEQFTP